MSSITSRPVRAYTFQDTTGWDGVAVTVTYNVPASDVPDSRNLLWQLKDSTGKIILADIDHPTQNQVRVTVDIPLDAGTYTLLGSGKQ